MWKFESLSVSFLVLVKDKVVFTLLLPGALLPWGFEYKDPLSSWRELPDKQNIDPEQDLMGDGVLVHGIDFLTFLFLLLFSFPFSVVVFKLPVMFMSPKKQQQAHITWSLNTLRSSADRWNDEIIELLLANLPKQNTTKSTSDNCENGCSSVKTTRSSSL